MVSDVFNNPSNDYINPGLAPCAGIADSYTFEFITDGAGVISGSEILQFIDLTSISAPVSSWVGRTNTLQSGEVLYVPGLTKGLQQRKIVYDIPDFGEDDQEYYFILDLSINYYYNFRYYENALDASANYTLNVSIDDALNIVFGDYNISATTAYDASAFTFTGDTNGYDFDITNVVLTIIDASLDSGSPFTTLVVDGERVAQTYTLEENTGSELPATKYPNGAMLGYMLKAAYPTTSSSEQSWIYINNVKSPYDVYESKSLDLDPSITIAFDASTSIGTEWTFTTADASGTIDASTMSSLIIEDGSISNSVITDSSIQRSVIYDSSLSSSYVDNLTINVTVGNNRPLFSEMTIWDTSISNGYVADSSIYSSVISDSSIVNCTLYNVSSTDSTNVNTRVINIDASVYNIVTDSSIYFERFSKTIDVGRNAAGTTTIMSAAEYLDYINCNNLWDKVGPLASLISAPDPEGSTTKNLVGGFYIFNPQTFSVQVEYILIN